MFKKYKILFLFLALFLCCLIFSSYSYATTDTFDFTGFDGSSYSLAPLPTEISSYNYYILVYDGETFDMLLFNENFEKVVDTTYYYNVTFYFDNRTEFTRFACRPEEGNSWWNPGADTLYSYDGDVSSVIYCSDNLMQYEENFNSSENFSFGLSDSEIEEPTSFDFVGLDGQEYSLPPLPEGMLNYTHFLLINDNGAYRVFGFNESLSLINSEGFVNIMPDKGNTHQVQLVDNSWEYYGVGLNGYSVLADKSTFLYGCNCVLSGLNKVNDGEDFFFNPLPVGVGTLPPIVEKINLGLTMEEILGILPIVILTLVGLIGLRKALQFLSTLLRRS